MEADDTDFDQAPDAQLQPVKRKLSRLKRAQTPAEQHSTVQNSPVAALSSPHRALSDRTNIDAAPQKSPPAALSPTTAAPAPSPSASQSPQPSPAEAAKTDSGQPEQSESQHDYWDSEDELEAELTRREKAEGFHADSAASADDQSQNDSKAESDSEADSPIKSGSPGGFDELNSQTQRVLRDSAKRDTIGQGQAVQRQPLSGILSKILSRNDAVAARAPVVPARPPRSKPQPQVSTATLAERLQNQAGNLVQKAKEPEDEDLLVLSDDDSDDVDRDPAAFAGGSRSLEQAKAFVAQHKIQPPHQNRLGLPVGSGVSAPQEDTQEMGFDSIPFEEPELFRLRSNLQALQSLGSKDHQGLNLTLDSQAAPDSNQMQEGGQEDDLAKDPTSTDPALHDAELHATDAIAAEPAMQDDADIMSGMDSGTIDDEDVGSDEGGSASGDASLSAQTDGSDDEEEHGESASESEQEEEAFHEGDEAASQAVDDPAAADTPAWSKQAEGKRKDSKQQARLRNQFIDEEAEMSEDEGHSQGDANSDSDDDSDLEDLIGHGKDRAGDESKRAKLHQQWLEQQDNREVARLMEGARNGFRRKRAGDLLDEDEGNDYETRKRRACQETEEDAASLDDEEDRLAGLLCVDDNDDDDCGLDEHDEQQLLHARARGNNAEPVGSIDLDAGSQEILALLSSASQGNSQGRLSSRHAESLAQALGTTAAPLGPKATFMGRSLPVLAGARGASQMASRSYVFGRDDSNSAAAPADAPGSTSVVTGPTSFAGLEGMLGDSTKASKAGASIHTSTDGGRKSSLLGRLAGKGKNSAAVEGLSAHDLQRALATSMGAQAVAQANKAIKRR